MVGRKLRKILKMGREEKTKHTCPFSRQDFPSKAIWPPQLSTRFTVPDGNCLLWSRLRSNQESVGMLLILNLEWCVCCFRTIWRQNQMTAPKQNSLTAFQGCISLSVFLGLVEWNRNQYKQGEGEEDLTQFASRFSWDWLDNPSQPLGSAKLGKLWDMNFFFALGLSIVIVRS